MNRFVTRPSVSAMRSSSTTSPRLPSLSNDVGNPSSSRMLGMSRFSFAACHSPYYHVMRSGGGSIMAAAFRSRRATNVVLPQPVGPATIHVNGCCQRVSMST